MQIWRGCPRVYPEITHSRQNGDAMRVPGDTAPTPPLGSGTPWGAHFQHKCQACWLRHTRTFQEPNHGVGPAAGPRKTGRPRPPTLRVLAEQAARKCGSSALGIRPESTTRRQQGKLLSFSHLARTFCAHLSPCWKSWTRRFICRVARWGPRC